MNASSYSMLSFGWASAPMTIVLETSIVMNVARSEVCEDENGVEHVAVSAYLA